MNEKQRHISDLLRVADREIKNGNLELAMAYIHMIFELEMKNVYAKAYKERIISLFEAQGLARPDAEKKAADIKPKDLAPSKVDVPISTPPPAAAPPPVIPRVEIPKPAPVPPPAPITPPPAAAPVPKQQKPVPSGPAAHPIQKIQRTAASSDAYRTLLLEIWKDGSISQEEQARVNAMRETFAITPEEHAVFEKEVRQSSYLNAIREEWRKGTTDFEPLRKKYQISDHDQIALEPKVFQLLQSLQSKGSVLILDDDIAFLNVIKDVLNDGGYYCFTAVTGEEGLRLLETMTPDIVICDINFSKPNMSGFAVYERFRSIDKFLTTPFLFVSALDQDVLIRTGKKLGADDYLLKPVDMELLIATVEGKLRRSRELKRAL